MLTGIVSCFPLLGGEGATKNKNNNPCFGHFSDYFDPQLQRRLLMPDDGSLALGENIVSQDEEISFKLCLFIHRVTCIIGF